MLNCTDLACVLHHHHFYAHLHQLKHHLQDENDNTVFGGGSDVNDANIQLNMSETDELSSLSHVDAPSDVLYMVFGVVIAMLLVGLVIILVAVTINKLRKREESTLASPTSLEGQQQPTLGLQNGCDRQNQISASTTNSEGGHSDADSNQEITFTRTSGIGTITNAWVFPPKAPTPNIYNCMNNDALMASNDKNGFRGFRKQFSGRFKRLVAKKPAEPAPAIPPELKPQLKTIYVY